MMHGIAWGCRGDVDLTIGAGTDEKGMGWEMLSPTLESGWDLIALWSPASEPEWDFIALSLGFGSVTLKCAPIAAGPIHLDSDFIKSDFI